MIVANMSLEEFLNDSGIDHGDYPITSEYLDIYRQAVGVPLKYIGGGYVVHRLLQQTGDMLLVHEGKLIGAYVTEVIVIDPAHQSQGLSVPLVLLAAAERTEPSPRKLTNAGRASLTKAWQVAHGLVTSPWWP